MTPRAWNRLALFIAAVAFIAGAGLSLFTAWGEPQRWLFTLYWLIGAFALLCGCVCAYWAVGDFPE